MASTNTPQKKKRQYIKPEIIEHKLDKQVSILMASIGGPPENPDNPFVPNTRSESIFENDLPDLSNTLKDTPFE